MQSESQQHMQPIFDRFSHGLCTGEHHIESLTTGTVNQLSFYVRKYCKICKTLVVANISSRTNH